MIDRKTFFGHWRESFGPLNQGRVDTLNLFLDYWEGRGLADLRWLAYAMATAHGEVGAGLQPVREGFAESESAARRHVARLKVDGRIKVNYALPHKTTGKSYYGRGYVQLTHHSNYEAMGQLLGLDLVNNPDLALKPDVAVKILFTGMERGTFTGARFATYFPHGEKAGWLNARRIINGTDKAQKFATLGETYYNALLAAVGRAIEPPSQPPSPTPPLPMPPNPPAPAGEPPTGFLALILKFIAALFNRKGP